MTRRIPILVMAVFALLVTPTIVAAADPALTATVMPGKEIDVAGSGFPADADVLLAIQRSGADAGSQNLRSDAAGNFTATIDAGPGRGGVYTMTATSGSATASVQALAVETAGGTGGGLQSTPPPTDLAPSVPGRPAPANDGALAMLVLIGACSLSLAISALRHRAHRTVDSPGLR
jgi:hypothetical protein